MSARSDTFAMLARVPILVKLFNKKGEMVYEATLHGKTRVFHILQREMAGEWTSGYIKVWYSRKGNYYNHFHFDNITAARQELSSDYCLDPHLVKEYSA